MLHEGILILLAQSTGSGPLLKDCFAEKPLLCSAGSPAA
jgi:hypothetical protein